MKDATTLEFQILEVSMLNYWNATIDDINCDIVDNRVNGVNYNYSMNIVDEDVQYLRERLNNGVKHYHGSTYDIASDYVKLVDMQDNGHSIYNEHTMEPFTEEELTAILDQILFRASEALEEERREDGITIKDVEERLYDEGLNGFKVSLVNDKIALMIE